jgi:hypothetical protein
VIDGLLFATSEKLELIGNRTLVFDPNNSGIRFVTTPEGHRKEFSSPKIQYCVVLCVTFKCLTITRYTPTSLFRELLSWTRTHRGRWPDQFFFPFIEET